MSKPMDDIRKLREELAAREREIINLPSQKPIVGAIYQTRNGSIVAAVAQKGALFAIAVLSGGHGQQSQARGREPGDVYGVNADGTYATGAPPGMHGEEVPGDEWKRGKKSEISPDVLPYRMLDLLRAVGRFDVMERFSNEG
jgi:hypothetical protein